MKCGKWVWRCLGSLLMADPFRSKPSSGAFKPPRRAGRLQRKPWSPERRAAWSAAQKARWADPDFRARALAARGAKPETEVSS
ncbi:MAG: hypothetical protein [Microviridae sp.]|nr:MAG: hypothetical protein [Microviridae sp.]